MEHNRFIRWMGENIADIYQRKTIDYFDSSALQDISNHLICPKNHPHIPMIGVGFSFTRRWIRLRLASNTQNYTLKKKEKCIYHFPWQVLTIYPLCWMRHQFDSLKAQTGISGLILKWAGPFTCGPLFGFGYEICCINEWLNCRQMAWRSLAPPNPLSSGPHIWVRDIYMFRC